MYLEWGNSRLGSLSEKRTKLRAIRSSAPVSVRVGKKYNNYANVPQGYLIAEISSCT